MKGNIIILSAPSGTGKTTILKRVMPELGPISFSISHTTRDPRVGEQNNVDYHFVSEEEFLQRKDQGDFIEWAKVHGNYYGTSVQAVLQLQEQGQDVVLDIDTQGARQVREKLPESSSIFIIPPSWEEQEKRLRGRGTDDEETIHLRLANAQKELCDIDLFDFVVVNDTLDDAAMMFKAIILTLRAKQRRLANGNPITLL
ncbi:MAG: guanylate kinase [Desulfobulbaceae bacterium]|nr:guanylate kinase [Desulfobulbaceae bacterium]